IDLLSELLRNSLYSKEDLLIPLSREIELINDYLELEKIRFEHRLTYTIEMDDQLQFKMLLPLSVQTLVENAIKHGIAKCSRGGVVAIRIEKATGVIKISVENPGNLINGNERGGLGLKNLKDRLALHYGEKGTLKISQLDHETVSAIITIPES